MKSLRALCANNPSARGRTAMICFYADCDFKDVAKARKKYGLLALEQFTRKTLRLPYKNESILRF